MPQPRICQISLAETPFYHCVSRCVRRAYLCGEDRLTGQSFEHRRSWVEDRLLELAEIFAIDLAAYAVMSNHLHVVLHVNVDAAQSWTLEEVLQRWHRLFSGTLLSQRHLRGEILLEAEQELLRQQAETWSERLISVSWFMRCLNEHIARQANAEDGCTGRFWEGRFKCQALLDEAALAACMAYVDLNPIRAKMAETPEASNHTSVQQRIKALTTETEGHPLQPGALMPFVGNPRQNLPQGLPFRLMDYLELIEWTGRQLREDKRGAIPRNTPLLLSRLRIEPNRWLRMTQYFEHDFKVWIGHPSQVTKACEAQGRQWAQGISACRAAFSG